MSRGILDAIDMDSYRVEEQAMQRIDLPDADVEMDPVPTGGGGHKPEPELERLSNILQEFNSLFGDIEWQDGDRVHRMITETIPFRDAADTAFRNAHRNSDPEYARIEHDRGLERVMTAIKQDDTESFKQYMDNDGFRRWLNDRVYGLALENAETVRSDHVSLAVP